MIRSLAAVLWLYWGDVWLILFARTCGRQRSPRRNRLVRYHRGGF